MDLNSLEAVGKMEKILLSWSTSKLTLPGKITVIKSLAFSKFIHLFTALTNPPEQLVKQLEKLFYKCLWNSGPDRISRNAIIQDDKEGVVGSGNGVVYLTSPGRPTEIGLQLGKACYPCSR